MSNARKVAANALLRVERDKAYSNIVINEAIKNANLNRQDAAFATRIFYGVLERKITLDYFIRALSTQSLSKVSPLSLQVLRCGVFQILYMDKIPNSAAVNESVNIIKKSKESRASGYVNAVLRGIIRTVPKLPKTDSPHGLSVNFSCSEELVKLYIKDYGIEETEKFLSSALDSSKIYLRVNPLKNSTQELIDLFALEDISAHKTDIENSLCVEDIGAIENNLLYKGGRFHVQDISSQMCADFLDAQSGQSVIDLCAAPGGKTFTICENMNNTGKIVSCDLHEHRVELIADGAKRLGLDIISPKAMDATLYNEDYSESFDRVLCDVPCSGSGVIGRKPDIKYKDFSDIAELSGIQLRILENGFKYLKHGGKLVYSTCSILKQENEEVVNAFLKNNPNAKVSKMHTFLPQNDNTDGFFVCVIEK